jgi:inositol-hexakisphosphate kinase
MKSHIHANHPSQPQYSYPPSPPSSASVTAHSSPRLIPLAANDPPIVGQYFAPSPILSPPNSQSTKTWPQQAEKDASDPDESVTAQRHAKIPPQSTPLSPLGQRKATRALTMPVPRTSTDRTQFKSPPKTPRPLFRKTSYSSSASSSSSGYDSNVSPGAQVNAGIGRKVAATLQLFKETTGSPAEALTLRESSKPESAGRHKSGPSHNVDDAPEAQYEFVKRSEWPDREAAAIRREKSSTGLSRVRTRDSSSATDAEPSRGRERKVSVRDTVLNDLAQWRKDVMHRLDNGRGRRLERTSDDTDLDMEVGSPGSVTSATTASAPKDLRELNPPSSYTHPRSRVYPPSPSPSRSPIDRFSLRPVPNKPTDPFPTSSVFLTSAQEVPSSRDGVSSHSRSPTPIQILSPTPVPPFSLPLTASLLKPPDPPHSPWSTDDESGWETASATTSTSTTSATSSHHLSPLQMNPRPYLHLHHDTNDKDRERRFLPIENRFNEPDVDALGDADDQDLDLDMSQGGLPHIPLRPFRNQVGGHSAIYKFTKRAVCKVRCNIFPFISISPDASFLYKFSRLYHAKTYFTSRWRERHHHYWGSSPDIWVLCS